MKNRTTHLLSLLSLLTAVFILSAACKKKSDSDNPSIVPHIPTVTTDSAVDITRTTATLGGNVTSQGSSSVSSRGVCWNTTGDPTILDSHTSDGSGTGAFTSYITGLSPDTLYYVRAYATNTTGTGYGNTVSFTTQPAVMVIGIDSLKNWFLANHVNDTMKIVPDFYVEGIISGNDQSGNIYKNLFFQDNTGGICIALDQVDLYLSYAVGQKIRVKCKDLYLGTYGTEIQIGYPYNGAMGRIPPTLIPAHLTTVGLPGLAPQPVVISMAHLSGIEKQICKLIEISHVTFPEAGQPFVSGVNSTSRAIADSVGTVSPLVLYTSPYCSFCYSLLPSGTGTLRGILTIYNGKFEMIVRDLNDLTGFPTK